MHDEKLSNAELMLSLFQRLRNLDLDHCPEMLGVISFAQMILLEQIFTNPGCGVYEIAERLNLSPPTVSVGVGKLEKGDLIERKDNPSDARAVQFFITQQGQSVYRRFRDARINKFRRLLSGLDSHEQNRLLQLLERALDHTENLN